MKFEKLIHTLSVLYVLGAAILLGVVCEYCYPQTGERLRQAMKGLENSALQTAFDVFADGISGGEPVREVFSDTVEVLISGKD